MRAQAAVALALALFACGEAAPMRTPPAAPPTPVTPTATTAVVPPELDAPPPAPAPAPRRPEPELPLLVRTTLDSGLVVGVARIPDAALCSVSLVIEAGGLDDRPGVAELAAAHIAAGAAGGFAGDRDFLRARGEVGELSIDVEAHRLVFTLQAAPEELTAAITHLGRLVARPALDQGRFLQLRTTAIELAESRSRDEPAAVARELVTRVLLGGGDPTSRRAVTGTRSELTRIRHGHVSAFYQSHAHPKRVWLLLVGAVGDVTPSIETAFAPLAKRGNKKLAPIPPAALEPMNAGGPRRVFLIDDPKASEARVFAVRAATRSSDHDALAILSATATVAPPGFTVWSERRAATAGALAEVRTTIASLDGLAPTSEEIITAKKKLLTGLPLLAHDPVALGAWLRLTTGAGLGDTHGLGIGQRLASLEPARVHALVESLAPTRVVVVFGDGDQIAAPLRTIGDVWVVDPRRGFDVIEKLPFVPKDDAG